MKILKVSLIIVIFLAGTSALILYGFYRYNNKENRTLTDADRKGIEGSFIKLSAGITHYDLQGPANGEVVILVHGFSVPYYIWDGTFKYLVKNGYKVLRYDMYGRGYSDRPDVVYNKTLYNNQLLDLIHQLNLKGKINIAGVSFGAVVTTNFSGTYPELINKVILIDPAYNIKQPLAPKYFTVYNEAVNSNERARSQVNDFKYPKLHNGWTERYLPQITFKGFRNALVSTLYNYGNNGRESNITLNNTNKDVLLIWGKDDKVMPITVSDSIRSVLKADFFAVTDAGHLPHIEKADSVNNKILAFLKH